MVFFVIVATGNHYWFDAARRGRGRPRGGGRRRQLARLRPAAWSWRSEDAQEATV